MLLNEINNKMPIYKDCTLIEIIFLSAVTIVGLGSVLSILSYIFFGYFWIGFTLTMLIMVFVVRILASYLQRLKYGKPYGFYQQFFIKKLSQLPILNALLPLGFVQYEGKWSVRYGHENH